jgi:predicted component of type VI protein secretion system
MEASLIVVKGKASKARITLKLPTIIGRSREVALTIAHPMVSRQHCELFEANGVLMIRDLGSLNGTMVDGRRVKEAPLPPETEFTVGPLTFRAEYEYAGDLTKLPAPVLADSSAAEGDVPDFQAFDESPATLEKNETEPEPIPPPKRKKSSPAPAKTTAPAKHKTPKESAAPKQPKVEPESESPKKPTDPDSIFDDFLNELD